MNNHNEKDNSKKENNITNKCEKECEKIYDHDLLHNKYDMTTLERNFNHLSEKRILFTQKLTAKFCIEYILDLDIDNGSEDSYLFDKSYILRYQPHITDEEFMKAFNLYYKD